MKHYLAALVSLFVALPLFAQPPTPPSDISARTTSAGYVEINWSRANDSDGFIVRYDLVRNGTSIPVGDVTRYIDRDIESGVRYTYQVAAIDNDNERAIGNSTVSISTSGSSSSISGGSGSTSNPQITSGPTSLVPSGYCGNAVSKEWAGKDTCFAAVETVSAFAAVCIDMDGDGWGWDGSDSCRIVNDNIHQAVVCVDTDGDGWGWDGVESCRMDIGNIPEVTVCIDLDGDGWGWTGSSSCIP